MYVKEFGIDHKRISNALDWLTKNNPDYYYLLENDNAKINYEELDKLKDPTKYFE